MTEEKLLPCPHCGGKAILDANIISERATYCSMCGLTGPEGDTSNELITSWNSLPRFKWRKWPEEKPEKEGHYFVIVKNSYKTEKTFPKIISCDLKNNYFGFKFWERENVRFWAEIPPIPDEKKV